jgi:hypothetical protein
MPSSSSLLQVRRAVDNYSMLSEALAANAAALTRSFLCLLASIWQHRRVPEDLLLRLEQDADGDSVLRSYLVHVGPAYKATFLYVASFAAFLVTSGGQSKTEVRACVLLPLASLVLVVLEIFSQLYVLARALFAMEAPSGHVRART